MCYLVVCLVYVLPPFNQIPDGMMTFWEIKKNFLVTITTKCPLNVLWISGVYCQVFIVTDYVYYAHIQCVHGDLFYYSTSGVVKRGHHVHTG